MPVLGRTAVVERIIWQVTLTRQAERRLAQNLGTRGSALPVLMTPNQTRPEEELPRRGGSLPVEAEPVRDRGCLPAAGDPELGQDPRDVDAGRFGGDEQCLANLSVGAALGDQGEDLGLTLGQAE
jgi:hypothetical protein